MSKESIQGPLSALRNAGTVSGLCLLRGTEVLVNMLPFSDRRVDELASVIDDLFYYFSASRREVDQFAFGFDGADLVVVSEGDFRLLVVHMLPEEIDFISKAARAFLIDFRLGLLAEELEARNALGDSGDQSLDEGAPPADASQPKPIFAEPAKTPMIRPLSPSSPAEDEAAEIEPGEAPNVGETKPEVRPTPETAKVPRMVPAAPPEPAPVPAPNLISWSARKKEAPAPPPPAVPASVPEPSPAVSPGASQPDPPTLRTHCASAPEEPESESSTARRLAHLAPNQPESTLPPRRMPRR